MIIKEHKMKRLLICLLCLISVQSFGTAIEWTGTVSGDLGNATNWNPNVVPTTTDTVTVAAAVTNQPSSGTLSAESINFTGLTSMTGCVVNSESTIALDGDVFNCTIYAATTLTAAGGGIYGGRVSAGGDITIASLVRSCEILSYGGGVAVGEEVATVNVDYLQVTAANGVTIYADASETVLSITNSPTGVISIHAAGSIDTGTSISAENASYIDLYVSAGLSGTFNSMDVINVYNATSLVGTYTVASGLYVYSPSIEINAVVNGAVSLKTDTMATFTGGSYFGGNALINGSLETGSLFGDAGYVLTLSGGTFYGLVRGGVTYGLSVASVSGGTFLGDAALIIGNNATYGDFYGYVDIYPNTSSYCDIGTPSAGTNGPHFYTNSVVSLNPWSSYPTDYVIAQSGLYEGVVNVGFGRSGSSDGSVFAANLYGGKYTGDIVIGNYYGIQGSIQWSTIDVSELRSLQTQSRYDTSKIEYRTEDMWPGTVVTNSVTNTIVTTNSVGINGSSILGMP